jgi:hypothetical protein
MMFEAARALLGRVAQSTRRETTPLAERGSRDYTMCLTGPAFDDGSGEPTRASGRRARD